eukprot:9634973-Alexandrium_andersonii.AAC.1
MQGDAVLVVFRQSSAFRDEFRRFQPAAESAYGRLIARNVAQQCLKLHEPAQCSFLIDRRL